jgi:hypothetical protein
LHQIEEQSAGFRIVVHAGGLAIESGRFALHALGNLQNLDGSQFAGSSLYVLDEAGPFRRELLP